MSDIREGDREDPLARSNGEVAEGGSGRSKATDDSAEPSIFEDPRALLLTGLIVLVMFGAIYFLLPNIIGLEDAIAKFDQGEWQWFAVAVGFNVAAFAAYVALFRGVIGENLVHLDWRESYQITMAGLAASRLLSAGGAGGVILSYWALRKAGMQRSRGGAAHGRLPRPPLLGLRRRRDHLRGPAADRRAPRPGAGLDDAHPGRDRRRARAADHPDRADPGRPAGPALVQRQLLDRPARGQAQRRAGDALDRHPDGDRLHALARARAVWR